jgi:hypothetical protein
MVGALHPIDVWALFFEWCTEYNTQGNQIQTYLLLISWKERTPITLLATIVDRLTMRDFFAKCITVNDFTRAIHSPL